MGELGESGAFIVGKRGVLGEGERKRDAEGAAKREVDEVAVVVDCGREREVG